MLRAARGVERTLLLVLACLFGALLAGAASFNERRELVSQRRRGGRSKCLQKDSHGPCLTNGGFTAAAVPAPAKHPAPLAGKHPAHFRERCPGYPALIADHPKCKQLIKG